MEEDIIYFRRFYVSIDRAEKKHRQTDRQTEKERGKERNAHPRPITENNIKSTEQNQHKSHENIKS